MTVVPHMCSVLIGLLLLAGCIESRPNHVTSKQKIQVPLNQPGNLNSDISELKIVCGESSCPKNVGLLLAKVEKTKKVALCTFTQLNDDQILTSNHCINQSKVEDIRFLFPDGKMEKSSQVLKVSNKMALLQLAKKRTGEDVQLGSSKVYEGQILHAWKIDETKEKNIFLLKRMECPIVFNTFISPDASAENSPTFSMVGCEIIPGNSGSPILNERGELVAVVESRIPGAELAAAMMGPGVPSKFKNVLTASNVHCLNVDSITPGDNALCDSKKVGTLTSVFMDKIGSNGRQQIESRVDTSLAQRTVYSILENVRGSGKIRYELVVQDYCKGLSYSTLRCQLTYEMNQETQIESAEIMSCAQEISQSGRQACL